MLRRGLETAWWITADDTGARHRGRNGTCTQIGNHHFAWFATTGSKSRLNFISLLRADHTDDVINDAALDYMGERGLSRLVIARLSGHGFLKDAVIVSDDAGQFNVGRHALCWVRAERLIHKIVGFNDRQRQAIERIRARVWRYYKALKADCRDPTPPSKAALEKRFERLFSTRTGFATQDRLLDRLHANTDELLVALERPDIPLLTNGSKNCWRGHRFDGVGPRARGPSQLDLLTALPVRPYSAADFADSRAATSLSLLSKASAPPRVSANRARSANSSSASSVNERSV